MLKLSRFLYRLRHSTHARKAGRSQLKNAKDGDHEQYLALAAGYLDLAVAYFGTTRSEPAEPRIERTSRLFQCLWQNLGYAERLSDFEYMLAVGLVDSASAAGAIASKEPLVTKLRLLPPEIRFAFLAYEFENWPLRWVALVMRLRPAALHRMLSEARCELCGIGWESLAKEERACLEAISESLDLCPNVRANKVLIERISAFPRIATIKAQWLELRPELVEVRHRYIPSQEVRERLLQQIFSLLTETPPQKPPFVARVVNTVHFSRHARIKVS